MFFTWDDVIRLSGEFFELSKFCQVSDELRGWSWSDSPVLFVGSSFLSICDVVSICDSGRDLFLKYVLGIRGKVSKSIARGFVVHFAFREFIHSLKRVLYNGNVRSGFELIDALKIEGRRVFPKIFDEFDLSVLDNDEVEALFWEVWKKGMTIYSGSFDKYLRSIDTKYVDSIVENVVPIDVEFAIDGSRIGLTNVRVDALLFPNIPVEIKVGEGIKPELAIAGYALCLESIIKRPIDFGIVVNVNIRKDLTITWKYRIVNIDDNLRMEFLHERDKRADIVDKKIDPGLSPNCTPACPYYEYCHGEKTQIRKLYSEKKAQERPSKKIKVKIIRK